MKKIGIVGCGIRGRLFARALAGMEGVELAGMCDTSAAARRSAGTVFEGRVLDSYADLYALGLDAAIIATPDFSHRDAAVAAASAGLTMMVEKPLATTVEDARAVHDAVGEAGVECLVAFENRWNPHCMRVKELVAGGALGEVIAMTGVLSNTYHVPLTMLPWAASSSPSWFLMPHIVDLALWWSGSRPVAVSGHGRRGELESRGVRTWDSVHALMTFETGAIANLQSSWVLPASRPGIVDFRFEVLGSRGAVDLTANEQGLRMATERWSTPGVLPVEIDGEEHGMAAWMVRSFARRVVTGEPLAPGVAHGLVVTETIAAVHAAIEGRGTVPFSGGAAGSEEER